MGYLVFLMALFYLIQTFSQNPGIFSLPLAIYLKEELHFSAAQLQAFLGLLVIPWMIKPLYGMISDGLPIFEYRRKSYFILCYSLAAVIFGWLASRGSYTVFAIGAGLMISSTCIAFSDVLTDAKMVEEGRVLNKTAVLQAAQWAALYLGVALMGYLGGIIAERATLSFAFGLTALAPLSGLAATLIFMRNEKRIEKGGASIGKSLCALWLGVKSSRFLAVAAFIVFLNFSPTPPLFYYQRDILKFNKEFIGIFDAVSALSSMIGAIVFGFAARKISRKLLLNLIIGLNALSYLGLIWMYDQRSAVVVALFIGFTGIIASLGILELAAKTCPNDAEGTSYALLMSIYNLSGQYGGGLIGGWLWDRGVAFSSLVMIGASFTLLCWFLIPLLRLERE